jgi:tetratricopeptide (TPR) repeat protein
MKKRYALVSCCILAGMVSISAGQDAAPGKIFSDAALVRGIHYAAEGKFVEAKEAFRETLDRDEYAREDFNVRIFLKPIDDALAGTIKKEAAIRAFSLYSIMLKASDGSRRGGPLAGGELRTLYEVAKNQLDRAIELEPGYPGFYILRAMERITTDTRQSLADCTKAIELDPGNTSAYYVRAIVYSAAGRPAEAISDFSTLVELDPGNVEGYMGRGRMYYEKSFLKHDAKVVDFALTEESVRLAETALDDFDKVIAMRPDFPFSYYYKARTLDRMERDQEALDGYTHFLTFESSGYVQQHARAEYDARKKEAVIRIQLLKRKVAMGAQP